MKYKCGCDPEGGSRPCKKHLAKGGLSLGKQEGGDKKRNKMQKKPISKIKVEEER